MSKKSFKLPGKLTFDTVESERARLLPIIQDPGLTNLCLDATGVQQCDSAGLALLLEAKRLCTRYNKRLALHALPESLQALAKFCGVDALLIENENG